MFDDRTDRESDNGLFGAPEARNTGGESVRRLLLQTKPACVTSPQGPSATNSDGDNSRLSQAKDDAISRDVGLWGSGLDQTPEDTDLVSVREADLNRANLATPPSLR